ncbi:hypothetical protein [Nitratireductor thuwali]|uniref:Uncharacterized protein n=1 Tax=Nitratireductor thuwali TaxID=2267699 RepID=A0ABY5MSF5_9HYPH|nr:hypothetical protein NTH_04298 [Nitratireductor thuwali]
MTDLMRQDDPLARRAVAALRHAYDAKASRRAARLATTRDTSGQTGHYQYSLV